MEISTIEVIIKEGWFEGLFKNYIPILATFVGLIIGYNQFKKQLDRSMYERRLNEVYALLYGHIVRQETIRELYLNHINIVDAPILTLIKRKTKSNIELTPNGAVEKIIEDTEETITLIDRKNFIIALNDTNKGLARPELLILINRYEILIHLEESLNTDSEEYNVATTEKVNVEYKLIHEIVNGYIETIQKLQLDVGDQPFILENLET